MFVSLTARNRHFVTVSLPLLGLLGAFGIAYPKYRSLRADQAALKETQRDLAYRKAILAMLQSQPPSSLVARLPATPDEPVEFLRNLNTVAGSCGVKITTYAVAPAAAPTPAAAGGAPGADAALPAGTTANTLVITAEGNYRGLALFFQRLETYPRLINVSQVTMQSKKYPLLTTQFQLSRYIGEAPGPAA